MVTIVNKSLFLEVCVLHIVGTIISFKVNLDFRLLTLSAESLNTIGSVDSYCIWRVLLNMTSIYQMMHYLGSRFIVAS